MIDKYKLTNKVELILEKDHFMIKAKTAPRQDWDKAFKKMHANGDDRTLLPDYF